MVQVLTVDYNSICNKMKAYLNQNHAKPIIIYGSTGGLGHKFICASHGMAVAFAGKRPVKCISYIVFILMNSFPSREFLVCSESLF